MAKTLTIRKGLSSLLFWSIISAAFIGPGTVTTASRSGAGFQLDLLWALVFSILATIVLQEAAARITIASGKSLGEIIALKYAGRRHSRLKFLLFFAVAFGCAAYQAGNMLGALAGIALFSELPRQWFTLILGMLCAAILWIGNYRILARLLGGVVALMGIAFIYVAFRSELPAGAWNTAFLPLVNNENTLLIIGLIGTTIVPYNLFLASGISQGQEIDEMRWGISLAVLIGGIISIAIMVVGTQVAGVFSFEALGAAIGAEAGKTGAVLFGLGLFAAGFSSSVTSPLAAAVTARSLFGAGQEKWSVDSRNFRLVWATVLGVGLLFGMLDVKPIPAIVLAQAINGVLLPIVAVFLLLAVNDRKILPPQYLNARGSNLASLLIVGITAFLGLHNISRAISTVLPMIDRYSDALLIIDLVLAAGLTIVLGKRILFSDGKSKFGLKT